MPSTFTKIASVTVGSTPVSTIDFSSIPSTYTDLCLKMSLRTNRAGTFDYVTINFNGSSANFSLKTLQGDGAGGSPASYNRGTFGVNFIGRSDGATATANTFANGDIYIPNYAGSRNKSSSTDMVNEDNVNTAYANMTAGLWAQTTAINQLTITNGTGNSYVQYSTATLYGIKNS
jgi:hypothetical protein